MIKKTVTIQRLGTMEARPLAMLVQTATRYRSAIYLQNGNYNVNAKSIMGMMNLGLMPGQVVQVTAEGTDETEAVKQIEEILNAASGR